MDRSVELASQYTARFAQADTISELERVGKELRAQVKAQLEGKDLARVRKAYATRLGQLKAETKMENGANGDIEAGTPTNGASKP